MKEPEKYGGDKLQCKKWRETLHAYLNSHDVAYTKLLLWIEDLGRRPFRGEDLLGLATEMRLDAEDNIEAKTTLYIMLCSCTTGSVERSIRRLKPKGIVEA